MKTKPKYPHDCESCIFVGHSRTYDVYFCKLKGSHVIARKEKGTASYSIQTFKKVLLEDPDEAPPWRIAMMEALRNAGIKL